MARKKETMPETKEIMPETDDRLEKIKQDLIARYQKKKFDLPYLVRAAGCTSSRDYLNGHLEELRQIMAIHFNWREE